MSTLILVALTRRHVLRMNGSTVGSKGVGAVMISRDGSFVVLGLEVLAPGLLSALRRMTEQVAEPEHFDERVNPALADLRGAAQSVHCRLIGTLDVPV